jgi:hypothetical protein
VDAAQAEVARIARVVEWRAPGAAGAGDDAAAAARAAIRLRAEVEAHALEAVEVEDLHYLCERRIPFDARNAAVRNPSVQRAYDALRHGADFGRRPSLKAVERGGESFGQGEAAVARRALVVNRGRVATKSRMVGVGLR